MLTLAIFHILPVLFCGHQWRPQRFVLAFTNVLKVALGAVWTIVPIVVIVMAVIVRTVMIMTMVPMNMVAMTVMVVIVMTMMAMMMLIVTVIVASPKHP